MNTTRPQYIKSISRFWRGVAFIGVAAVAFFMSSCSENDDTTNEWENWQEKNETYWTNLYTQAQQQIAAGDSTWKIIPSWTLSGQTPTSANSNTTSRPMDYIIVHVEHSGTGKESPMYTDSVRIHYLGRLIPSPTYTSGYIFDASYDYTEPYNLQTMRPYTAVCRNFITGFTTALLNMHKGDRWLVYIPYELDYGASSPGSSTTSTGYGSSYSTSTTTGAVTIQPYSNLIFDLTLVDYYKPGEKVPVAYSKKQAW